MYHGFQKFPPFKFQRLKHKSFLLLLSKVEIGYFLDMLIVPANMYVMLKIVSNNLAVILIVMLM